ncbi:MAG TPA: carnitine dehydratase [Deltaproteobacteria bacterium]|nr:carnitine dehydratase [Deltaproteobacteria bacterium]
MAQGPLSGVKVVEITMFQQGPVAGVRLGDLGADVIKIETKAGDPARGFMNIIGAMTGLKGNNYYFEHNNRNKRSVVIDLKSKKGKEIFLKLIDQADVFVNNMSIDAPLSLGIGPDDLLARNPRLIYAHASGWGRKGPAARELSFDYTGIARSGLMMCAGERGGPPAQILPGIGDEIGGLMCAWGVTIALYAREKTGKGQVVDTSLMGSTIAMLGLLMEAPAVLGQEFGREERASAGNPLYNHYRCKDDAWIVIAHLQPDVYWKKICRAVGIADLQDDPRFGSVEERGKHARELVSILDERFATKTREEWLRILKEEGCICTPIQSPIEVSRDPQALANNYFIDVHHPSWGKIKMVGFPWDFSETPASWHREAPALGAHTEEVLLEAGYTKDEITRFREEGAIQ